MVSAPPPAWPGVPEMAVGWGEVNGGQRNGQVLAKDMAAVAHENAGNPDVSVRRGTNPPGANRRGANQIPADEGHRRTGGAGERYRADGWLAGVAAAGLG